MSHVIFICVLIASISFLSKDASAFPAVTSDPVFVFDEDYPSDTHSGAETEFSLVVVDDPSSSRSNHKKADNDERRIGSKENSHDDYEGSKTEGLDESDESDAQYSIEDMYIYDETTNTEFDDVSSDSSTGSVDDDY